MVGVWGMHYCMCNKPHPALCPLTQFSIAWSACRLQYSSTLSDTHALSPESVEMTTASLPLQFLNLLVSNKHLVLVKLLVAPALVCVCVCLSVCFFDFVVAPLVRHRLRAHGKYALRQPTSWRRYREEMREISDYLSTTWLLVLICFGLYMWFLSSLWYHLQ